MKRWCIIVVFMLTDLWNHICYGFTPPLVIAHRGASGYRPEHTLASYELSMDMKCDFVELDLVITKDNILIAMHHNDLNETTDIADHPEYSNRKVTKRGVNTWFTEDFTLSEIKTLRAKERFSHRIQYRNGLYHIPTITEALQLIRAKSAETGKTFGIYMEVKWGSYFTNLGFPIEKILVDVLKKEKVPKDIVFIESFDQRSLQRLNQLSDYPLVQLISTPDDDSGEDFTGMLSEEGLQYIASYADGIGPNKGLIYQNLMNFNLIERAHKYKLVVHPWTLRTDEYLYLFSLYILLYLISIWKESPKFYVFRARVDVSLRLGCRRTIHGLS